MTWHDWLYIDASVTVFGFIEEDPVGEFEVAENVLGLCEGLFEFRKLN